MNTPNSDENVVFNYRTLRLIIGALAFAFPAMVGTLAGKITTSISASYYEAETRDVFVGFLFIIGALLISYKGHIQIEPENPKRRAEGKLSFARLKRHQEEVVSTLGGVAAILTALYPTACDGCAIDTRARIHLIGAFVLFSTVVYFCMVAFLRRVNQKLLSDPGLEKSSKFWEQIDGIRTEAARHDVYLPRRIWNFLTVEIRTFLVIAASEYKRYGKGAGFVKLIKLLQAHNGKFDRGLVYVACGSLISVTLVSFVVLLLVAPDMVANSSTTFIVETIALALFGTAWLKASQLSYFRQIRGWLTGRLEKQPAALQQTDPA